MYSKYSRVKKNKLYSRYFGCRRKQFVICIFCHVAEEKN